MAGIIWGISRALHEGTKFDRATWRCVSRNQVTRGLMGRSGPFKTGAGDRALHVKMMSAGCLLLSCIAAAGTYRTTLC